MKDLDHRAEPAERSTAAKAVLKELEKWKKGENYTDKEKKKEGINDEEIQQLEFAMQEEIMKAIPPEPNEQMTTSFLHGTDAVAEILSQDVVRGGTAAAKNLGAGAIASEAGRRQELHFFTSKTDENGIVINPGHSFIQARKNANAKVGNGSTENGWLSSWKKSGRPLLGFLEFGAGIEKKTTSQGVDYKIPTPALKSGDEFSMIPLEDLEPKAIRMINESDVVRLIDYLASEGAESAKKPKLPPLIRVLKTSEWSGLNSEDAFSKIVNKGGDFHRLATGKATGQTQGGKIYKTYDTKTVLEALGVADKIGIYPFPPPPQSQANVKKQNKELAQ